MKVKTIAMLLIGLGLITIGWPGLLLEFPAGLPFGFVGGGFLGCALLAGPLLLVFLATALCALAGALFSGSPI